MLPTQQGFETANFVAFQVHKRLVVQDEIMIVEGAPHIPFEVTALLHAAIHFLLKTTISTPTIDFRPAEGKICIFKKLVGIIAIIRRDRDTNADAYADLMSVKLKRCADGI